MKRTEAIQISVSRSRIRVAGILCALLTATGAVAQFADWTTLGFDAQRSNWQRSDNKISLSSMRKPGFELVWKSNVNQGRQQHRLTPPVLLDFYISYRGFRSLAFVGGSGNSVIAYDADLGRVEWRKDFKVESGAAGTPTPLCPGGMTSNLSRPAIVGYPPALGSGGTGRGTPAKSGVGEPFEGAVTIRPRTPAGNPPPSQAKAVPAATRRIAVAQSVYAPRVQLVHSITPDGKLHSMYVSNGEEPKPPVQFLPANAYAESLLVVDNVAYAITVNGCNGVENGIWALDLQSQKVSNWKTEAGPAGFAAGPDGVIYLAAGDEIAFLQGRTLERKNSYRIGSVGFASSPVVFDGGASDMIAAVAKDGSLHVVDSSSASAVVVGTAALPSGQTPSSALSSWSDSGGLRWILGAASGGSAAESGNIVAWKLVQADGNARLEPGWTSSNMASPLAPIVVNGVIFALASGEFQPGDAKVTTAERTRRSSAAILYALDSTTGKELWNSGKTITSYVSTGGLVAGGSRVYVAAQDGTQYVFGFPIEH